MSNDLKSLMRRVVNKLRDDGIEQGTLGVHRPDTSVDMQVTGRAGWLHVTLDGQTPVKAFNKAGVPQTVDLQVEMRVIDGRRVIIGMSGNDNLAVVVPVPASGVVLHASTHQHGGTDEVATATPAANAIPKADGSGLLDGWVTSTAASITAASTDDTIVDADVWGYLTGGALVKTTWANIKAVLKTYQDTLYVALTGNQTVAGIKTFTDRMALAVTTTTGAALSVVRDLASASTNSPVVSIVQDNAGDDQAALYVQQDGSGDIIQAWDGGTKVFSVADGGNVKIEKDLIISPGGTQDYKISDDTGNALTTQSQNSGTAFDWRMETMDADATDAVLISFWARGKTGATSDRSRLIFGYDPALLAYKFFSEAQGTGTLYPLIFYTEGNDNQLVIASDGKVSVGVTSPGASKLGIQAGTSTNDAAAGGVLYVSTASAGNTTTGEDDLTSYSVPADTLSTNNMSLEFHAWGTLAANSNAKTIKVYFGSDSWTMTSAVTWSGSSWSIRGRIMRTGAATQDVMVDMVADARSGTVVVSTATRTLSSANTLKLTGEATATNDIVQQGFVIKWLDANT